MSELLPCPFCGGKAELIEGGPGNAYVRCTVCAACGNDSLPNPAIMRWNRRAARSAPEAGKAVDWRGAMQLAIDYLKETKHGSPARSAGHNARLVLEAALASVPAPSGAEQTSREVGWLIERKYPVNSIGSTEPRWYAERPNGDHWWTPVPNEAKRFTSKAEAEAYPAYQMIASDPTISITEHVWINDGFSWSHGRAAPQAVPAEDVAEQDDLSETIEKLRRSNDEYLTELGRVIMACPQGMRTSPASDGVKELSAALTASEAEVTSLRRKLEEHRKALEPFGKDADGWADSVPDEYRPRCTEPGNEYAHPGSESAFSVGDLRRARTLSGASE